MNLVSLGEENVKNLGEKLALVYEGKEFTNVQLYEMGKKLAWALKSLGIGRGDHVVVSLPNSPEVWPIFGAIWRIGAVIVPIMFLLGEEVMAFVVVKPGQELCTQDVIAYAHSRMTKFKCPSRVKFVDALPKSLVGKVLKQELRKML